MIRPRSSVVTLGEAGNYRFVDHSDGRQFRGSRATHEFILALRHCGSEDEAVSRLMALFRADRHVIQADLAVFQQQLIKVGLAACFDCDGLLRRIARGTRSPLFLTLEDGGCFGGMVRDHRLRHLEYCSRYGYDYSAEPVENVRYSWTTALLIYKHLVDGIHSHIFWIDPRTVIHQFDSDMRETLPDLAWVAGLASPSEFESGGVSIQTGALYVRCTSEAVDFFGNVIRHCEDFRGMDGWDERACMNNLFREPRWRAGLHILSNTWPDGSTLEPFGDGIAASWLGSSSLEARRKMMLQFAIDHPYDSVECVR